MSPRCTRRVGPGTWPPKVQVLTTKPSATVMSLSMIGKSTSWTVPSRSLGAVASKRVYLGAFGSATGAADVPPATGPGVAAGAAPATMTSPFIPASAWPGIEHTKASPAAGTVTVPVALFPPSALSLVPSAKVTSWRVEPVFLNSTSYVPAAGTEGIAGVKPRSNASIEIFSACAGEDWGAATTGCAAPVVGGAEACVQPPVVAPVVLPHAVRARARPANIARRGR